MTENLNRRYEQELEIVRRWLAAGLIADYMTRDQYGEIYIKAEPADGWDLCWSFRQAMEIHHPEESDYYWGMEP